MPAPESFLDRVLRLVGLDFTADLADPPRRFDRIAPDLLLGPQPTAGDLGSLQQAGVTHVVSALVEQKRHQVAFLDAHFDTLFVPLHDGMHEDIGIAAVTVEAFVAAARASHPGAQVLVHCRVGVSRSAALVVALQMKVRRQGFYDTFVQVRGRRPGVLPNIGFASWLQRFERDLGRSVPAGPSSLARYLHHVCRVPAEVDAIDDMLLLHDFNAPEALQTLFGGDIPRVVQGVRV